MMYRQSKKHGNKMRALEEQMLEENRSGDFFRARSVSVGTAFGGTVEITMRRNDGTVVWAPLQPVEAIELIHQLAASVGCHLHLTPRRDFAAWREWQVTEEERLHLNGHPPFANDMANYMHVGKEVGYKTPKTRAPLLEDNQNADPALAIEKPKKRSSVKRAAAAS